MISSASGLGQFVISDSAEINSYHEQNLVRQINHFLIEVMVQNANYCHARNRFFGVKTNYKEATDYGQVHHDAVHIKMKK